MGRLFLPAEERRDGDEAAEDPDGGDHDDDPLGRPLAQVLDGVRDGPVAVETDEAEVHDARRAEEDVDGRMNVAPPLAKDPVAHHLVGQRERHNDEAEEEVGDGQGADEPVLDPFEGSLREDGDDDERIAAHHHDHDDGDENGRDEETERRVAARVDDARPPGGRQPRPVDQHRRRRAIGLRRVQQTSPIAVVFHEKNIPR